MKTNFPISGELFVWFLFTGIQLDCLFFMKHHQHCVVGWETKFHSIPSLSDSGVVLVREALTQLLEGGNGVDAVFRKSRGADAAPPGPRLQASGSPLWWPEMAALVAPELCLLCPLCFAHKSSWNVSAVLSPALPFSSYIRGIPSSHIKLLILMVCVTVC